MLLIAGATSNDKVIGVIAIHEKLILFFIEGSWVKKAGSNIRGKVFAKIPNPKHRAAHFQFLLSFTNKRKAKNDKYVGIVSSCPKTAETEITTGEKTKIKTMFCLSFISFSGKNSKKNMNKVSAIIAENLNKKAKLIPVTVEMLFQKSNNRIQKGG